MPGTPFYDVAIPPTGGIRGKAATFARRVLGRLLRPIFGLIHDELLAVTRRQEQLDQQGKAALALGWDQVAVARRLAAIEDRLDELMSRGAPAPPDDRAEDGCRPSIPYPGRDAHRAEEPQRHVATPSRAR